MKKWSVSSVAALIIVGAVAFMVVRGERPRQVYAATVAYRVLSPTILASGTLTHEQEVTLVPEMPGRVLEILVKEILVKEILVKEGAAFSRASC